MQLSVFMLQSTVAVTLEYEFSTLVKGEVFSSFVFFRVEGEVCTLDPVNLLRLER